MASFLYNGGLAKILSLFNSTTAAALKVRLVMTNTTVDTENDTKDTLNDFTTMDTHDGSGYVDKTLASITIAQDDTNGGATLDAADVVWTSLGAGTRAIEGALVYHEDAAADSTRSPILFFDTSNISSNGGDVTLSFNASGLFRITGTGAP